MKDHDEDYEGRIFTVEVTNNGFLLVNNNTNVTGWKSRHFNNFTDLVDSLAGAVGILDSGEIVSNIQNGYKF